MWGPTQESEEEVVGIEFDFAEEPFIVFLFERQHGRQAKARAPITRDAVKQLAALIPKIVEGLDSA